MFLLRKQEIYYRSIIELLHFPYDRSFVREWLTIYPVHKLSAGLSAKKTEIKVEIYQQTLFWMYEQHNLESRDRQMSASLFIPNISFNHQLFFGRHVETTVTEK